MLELMLFHIGDFRARVGGQNCLEPMLADCVGTSFVAFTSSFGLSSSEQRCKQEGHGKTKYRRKVGIVCCGYNFHTVSSYKKIVKLLILYVIVWIADDTKPKA